MQLKDESIFEHFCQHVDETIFQNCIGGVVSFVVDQTYIDIFCEKYSITEKELLRDVRRYMFQYNITLSINHIKGVIAIQIYATTKRAENSLISKANYRKRLAELLFLEVGELDNWFKNYQDNYWKRLYDWCDNNYIEIPKSYPRDVAWRYVQYPTLQAERVFTREELLYIAYAFIENLLYPEDDVSFKDFWIILNWWSLYKYVHTKHAINLYENYREDAEKQIFNYFLNWNGEYKIRHKKVTNVRRDVSEERFIYIKDDLEAIEVRNKDLKLIGEKIQLISLNHITFINRSSNEDLIVRRNDMILFKKDDVYDNYWQETRFLEGEENGLVILFTENRWKHFPQGDLIKVFPHLRIYKVEKNWWTRSLYVEPRFYKLEGGLKIGRHKYLLQGAPIFRINRKANVWINGTYCAIENKFLDLNYLGSGIHRIKVQEHKEITIEVIESTNINTHWSEDNNQWLINKKDKSWIPAKTSVGVVGMNLGNMCEKNLLDFVESQPIRSWAETHHSLRTRSKNIIIQTLKNIQDYE